MRVLFMESHPMLVNALPNGFRDIGADVLVSGPLNSDNIPRMLIEFHPDIVLTAGWTPEAAWDNMRCLRSSIRAANIPLVYWATEDPTHTHSFTLPYIQRLQPTFVFTICPRRVPYYRALGIRSAHLDFGYHQSVHHPVEPEQAYRCSVAVVANGYPTVLKQYPQHYRIQSINDLVTPLIRENIRVDFWGRGWEDMAFLLNRSIPQEWLHGYLEYTLANIVYSSADIVLGIQNHTTQLSQRTYEILGSGGFLLTSDTPEVRRLFQPGKDLAVSASPAQTVELVRHYLGSEKERLQISEQGQQAVAVHNYAYRARQILNILRQEGIL